VGNCLCDVVGSGWSRQLGGKTFQNRIQRWDRNQTKKLRARVLCLGVKRPEAIKPGPAKAQNRKSGMKLRLGRSSLGGLESMLESQKL